MSTELKNGIKTFHARTRRAWRKWLEKNHEKEKSLWLILYHRSSETPSVNYSEAVEEALCFGWIDSTANRRDGESSYRFFAKRKPKSNWSGLNKRRVKKLIDAGLMTDAGLAMVKLAKKTGTWTALDEVEKEIIPPDVKRAFEKNKTAYRHFMKFSPSSRRIILGWIHSAKRPETRNSRIEESVRLAAKNIKANHYRQ